VFSEVDAIAAGIIGDPSIVLIDGRSGSGKTELATALAAALGAQVLRLDDVYPGWDGLEAASKQLAVILETGRWQRWDWTSGRLAEQHTLDLSRPLIVEGSGTLTRATLAHATYAIWVELDEPTRKRRALARDGEMYEPHWDAWAVQEQRHFERDRPDLLADLVVSQHGLVKREV
jgi:dephospho-CoA kinase